MAKTPEDSLLAWQVVQKLVTYGEIAIAARQLDLDAPQASRLLKSLEDSLGFAIFDRSTRPFKIYPHAKQILNSLELLMQTRQQLLNVCRRAREGAKTTKIRLGVATGTRSSLMFSLIRQYEKIDPSLEISIQNFASFNDIREHRLHIGYFPYLAKYEDLLCVPVTTVFMLSLASPIYLARNGRPNTPEELTEHITLQRDTLGYPITKGLWKHQYYRSINPKKIWYMDNITALSAAIEGEGIALDVPLSMARSYIQAGKLTPSIGGWHRQCWHYSLVCSYSVLREIPALGNFIEWLMLKLQEAENNLWKTVYRECGESFPIDSEENGQPV